MSSPLPVSHDDDATNFPDVPESPDCSVVNLSSNNDMSDEEEPLTKRPRSNNRLTNPGVSVCWDYFTFDKVKNVSNCNDCKLSIPKRTTSNNIAHLKKFHTKLYKEYLGKEKARKEKAEKASSRKTNSNRPVFRQLKIGEKKQSRSCNPYPKGHPKQMKITSAITVLIANNSMPHSLIEFPEFRHLVHMLDPSYTFPNRTGIRQKIIEKVAAMRVRIADTLQRARKLTLVLDGWTTRRMSESYLGVICYFWDPKLKSTVRLMIGLKEVLGRKTAEVMLQMKNSLLQQWAIPESKVSFYVTDNGSDMVCALKEQLEWIIEENEQPAELQSFEESEFQPTGSSSPIPKRNIQTAADIDRNLEESFVDELDIDILAQVSSFDSEENSLQEQFGREYGRCKRLPCIAHSIVCALRNTIDRSLHFKPLIKKVMDLVNKINKSPKLRKLLKVETGGKNLVTFPRTRWLFAKFVLDRLLLDDVKEGVKQVIRKEKLVSLSLSDIEWDQLHELRDFLKPFAEQVTVLEGDKYPTINLVIPSLVELISICDKFSSSASDPNNPNFSVEVEIEAENVKIELESRFDSILNPDSDKFQPIYCVGTFLTPIFRDGLENLEIPAKEELLRLLKKNVRQTTIATVATSETNDDAIPETSTSSTLTMFPMFAKRCKQRMTDQPNTTDQNIKAMINQYSSESFGMTVVENLDPINYWIEKLTDNAQKPLAQVALDILSVPASSAGCERLFSHAGISTSGKRTLVGAQTLENELMLKMNLEFVMD